MAAERAKPPLRYALVTPARDERANLGRLATAVRAQTLPPACWVIVDDGSRDGTREFADALAADMPIVRVLDKGSGSGALHEGRREGRDLLAFQHGVRSLPAAYDVVVKLDADLSFEADYFAELIARFAADPLLGIASGACHEFQDGHWQRRRVVPTAVWGASRAYRWECLEDVMQLAPKVGWDGIDEIKAQLRGFRTGTVVELPFHHHRPEGERESAKVRAHALSGQAAWYMGYRPSYLTLRALYRARHEPAAIGMLWGYFGAAGRRAPRCPDERLVRALRERQRLRATLRRGAPQS